jgi:hypothetical protein
VFLKNVTLAHVSPSYYLHYPISPASHDPLGHLVPLRSYKSTVFHLVPTSDCLSYTRLALTRNNLGSSHSLPPHHHHTLPLSRLVTFTAPPHHHTLPLSRLVTEPNLNNLKTWAGALACLYQLTAAFTLLIFMKSFLAESGILLATRKMFWFTESHCLIALHRMKYKTTYVRICIQPYSVKYLNKKSYAYMVGSNRKTVLDEMGLTTGE